jgi:hypothetical protein
MSEPRTVSVPVTLLVTDVGAFVLDSEEQDAVMERIREVVRWENARAIEIRKVEFPVQLLETPVLAEVTALPVLNIPQDIKDAVTQVMKERRMQIVDQSWDLLMDAMQPGLYRIYKEEGVRGISRVKEEK